MSPATATRSSGVPESYYAPDFLVEIEGSPLEPAAKADVLELRVTMSLDEISSVDLRLNNFDARTFDLKWSDSDRFRLGGRVHVKLGYADRLVSMLGGTITTLAPEFLASGAPTLTVRALDGLVVLKDSSPPRDGVTYRGKKDWQIAQEIARRHNLIFKYTDAGPVRDEVVQRGLDDLAFLRERAALLAFDVFMHVDPGSGKDVLHFVRPSDGRDDAPIRTYSLAWGSLRSAAVAPSMIEFKPTISTADQVQSVTVQGWDAAAKQAIEVTASSGGEGPAAAGRLGGADGKRRVLVNLPQASADEAQTLAEALLEQRTRSFVTARAKVIGLPDLRPGDNVDIGGVGATFGGTYYVTKTTHVFNASGFVTEFEARRTQEGRQT